MLCCVICIADSEAVQCVGLHCKPVRTLCNYFLHSLCMPWITKSLSRSLNILSIHFARHIFVHYCIHCTFVAVYPRCRSFDKNNCFLSTFNTVYLVNILSVKICFCSVISARICVFVFFNLVVSFVDLYISLRVHHDYSVL